MFFSARYKISSDHVPEELAENPKDLNKRAAALVELAADSWVVTGRRPVPIIMAAIYLSWQSLRPNKQRLKTSLEKFCQIAQVKKLRPALKRIVELKDVLCKLGKEIPWVTEVVTADTVVLHLEDILKHRYALLRRAMQAHEEALLAECETSCEDSQTQENNPSHISEPVEQSPNLSSAEQRELNTGRSERPGGGSDSVSAASELHSQQDQEPPQNWGKRVLFAPPCVIHAKKRRAEQPELKDVTGDEEISDSEIDSYIRSPREARDFALAQKIMSLSESEKS